mmetsp:Transcript_5420/g.7327  ORF Transcript_5420/g.7327 Transcript_5420/m.7327 type:complete len:210 (-) Transcript_5420:155-784(-)|eukprot:CAMPEP_0196575530 /NCGR_PEP_ID=MMETSP1081-20130531/4991_1 /TAXON_ID=36882 /ORGANISM="Pyramimonas amylifera, Strain CCMP720" /LENGTH=209 /DNA_ID=CAMNT_0041893863 /DNA_START=78 /DNA_END=707 /DNA_ORIENTATION=-
MGALSFDQSGQGEFEMTLADVQNLAINLGYVKASVPASKPLAARATMGPFFDQYGVKAFSTFKQKFFQEPLVPISPGGVPMKSKAKEEVKEVKAVVVVKPEDIPPVSQYEELLGKFKDLKWRIISRPGGATMKPTDWYRLEACSQQASAGDNETEKPMWAAHGGLDFNGRESWDQWAALKGKSKDDAKQEFCRVWAEAHADPKANFRMY